MAIIKAITPRQSSLGEKGIAFVVSIASHSLQFSREIWRQAGSQSKLYSKWISVWEFYEYFQKKKNLMYQNFLGISLNKFLKKWLVSNLCKRFNKWLVTNKYQTTINT